MDTSCDSLEAITLCYCMFFFILSALHYRLTWHVWANAGHKIMYMDKWSEEMAGCIWARQMIEGVQESLCHVKECSAQLQSRPSWWLLLPADEGKWNLLIMAAWQESRPVETSTTSELPMTHLLTFQWQQHYNKRERSGRRINTKMIFSTHSSPSVSS